MYNLCKQDSASCIFLIYFISILHILMNGSYSLHLWPSNNLTVIVNNNKRLQSINTLFPRKNIQIFKSTSASTHARMRTCLNSSAHLLLHLGKVRNHGIIYSHTHTFSLSDINTHHTHTCTNIHRRTHTYIYVCIGR